MPPRGPGHTAGSSRLIDISEYSRNQHSRRSTDSIRGSPSSSSLGSSSVRSPPSDTYWPVSSPFDSGVGSGVGPKRSERVATFELSQPTTSVSVFGDRSLGSSLTLGGEALRCPTSSLRLSSLRLRRPHVRLRLRPPHRPRRQLRCLPQCRLSRCVFGFLPLPQRRLLCARVRTPLRRASATRPRRRIRVHMCVKWE